MFSFLCLLFSFSQVNVPRLFRNFSVAAAAVYVVVRSRSFDHLNTSIRQIWSTETYNILFRRHASELYVLCRQAVFPSRVFFVRHLLGSSTTQRLKQGKDSSKGVYHTYICIYSQSGLMLCRNAIQLPSWFNKN